MGYLSQIAPDVGDPTPADSTPAAVEPPRTRRSRPAWLIALIVVVGLASIGAVGWLLLRHATPAPKAATTKVQSLTPQPDTTGNASPTAYVSKGQDLSLSIVYPSSWTVTPPTGGNANDQAITLTSPRVSMVNADSESVVARAILSIRPKNADITELDAGTVTVANASIQIAYSHPSKIQHSYPYITFIHLMGGDNPKRLFEEVMITGANRFSSGQTLSSYSLLQLDPIISVTLYQCLTEACSGSGAQPLSITNDIWQTSDLGQQALAIFQSLQLH